MPAAVDPLDPVDLTARLIRCPSVTPEEGGALVLLEQVLAGAGFACTRVDRNGTSNLFARWGDKGANRSFGFNGHTDVVPPGNPADWRFDPFSGAEAEGRLWGRGACDMKSGVAAFVAAAVDFVRETQPGGAVILAITGDEEGDATDGTVALLDWMATEGERMSHCIVGEPTCPEVMGQMMKNGRRGSMTARIEARGVQGHSAYPHRARNPLSALVRLLDRLASHQLDRGNALFDPSTLAITSVDTGNTASNVIPAKARAMLNIRFNDLHTGASLTGWLESEIARVRDETGVDFSMMVKISGESFVTEPGWFTDLVADAVEAVCDRRPVLSTTGGTSDARFIKNHCPVVEFGLVGQSMHKVDEHVAVDHVHQLKSVYRRMLEAYFA
ncbi:MAG: succinyl-diaminopimelate desuccinylase [Rhodobacteraceae bacterium]|nr:succinyl-diaminopimelate desuccinylase [Paracoccaceae bacterium]